MELVPSAPPEPFDLEDIERHYQNLIIVDTAHLATLDDDVALPIVVEARLHDEVDHHPTMASHAAINPMHMVLPDENYDNDDPHHHHHNNERTVYNPVNSVETNNIGSTQRYENNQGTGEGNTNENNNSVNNNWLMNVKLGNLLILIILFIQFIESSRLLSIVEYRSCLGVIFTSIFGLIIGINLAFKHFSYNKYLLLCNIQLILSIVNIICSSIIYNKFNNYETKHSYYQTNSVSDQLISILAGELLAYSIIFLIFAFIFLQIFSHLIRREDITISWNMMDALLYSGVQLRHFQMFD